MTDSELNVEEIARKVDYLTEVVRNLEHRLRTLEQSLEQANTPGGLPNSVQVTGSREIPEVGRINLSESELLTMYNNLPNLLEKKVIKVSVTEESLLKQYNEQIFLVNKPRGNYWIVATEDSTYWLLPKGNLRLDAFHYETVKSLFNCYGYQTDNASEFTLSKPARVSLMPSGEQWKLEEPGELYFGDTYIEKTVEPSADGKAQQENQESADDLLKHKAIAVNVQLLHTLTGHTHSVRSLAISRWQQLPNKQIVASGSFDTTIKIWNLNTSELLCTLPGHLRVNTIAMSPDGQILASGGEANTISILDLVNNAPPGILTGHSDWIRSLAISADGHILASGSHDETIKIWHLPTREMLHTLSEHNGRVLTVAISPNRQILASGSADNTIKLWNLNTGKQIITLFGHTNLVWCVAFSPDGQTLASGAADNTIKLWNVNTAQLQRDITGHSEAVLSLAISPNRQILVSGSLDKTIKLWNLNTGEMLTTLTGHTKGVFSVAMSPDGHSLVSGSRDETIKIWKIFS